MMMMMMMKEKEREDGKHGCFGQNKVHPLKGGHGSSFLANHTGGNNIGRVT